MRTKYKKNPKFKLTLASESSNSFVMNNLRHGSLSGAVKWRLHLIMPHISQSTGLTFGSCLRPKYFWIFCMFCEILDLCCNATIIAVHPAANEKLIINPKNILQRKTILIDHSKKIHFNQQHIVCFYHLIWIPTTHENTNIPTDMDKTTTSE